MGSEMDDLDRIPKDWVDRNYEEGKKCMLFGVPIEALSNKVLIAAIHHSQEELRLEREQHSRSISLFRGCRR